MMELYPRMPSATQPIKDAYQSGNWAEAQRLCQQILADDPDHFDALNISGIIAAQSKQPEEAIDRLSRAAKVNPNHAAVHGNLGNVLLELGRHEAALALFQRALEIDPSDADTHYRCSSVLGALKRYEATLESCNQALRIKPDYVEALNNRGNALECLHRPEEALESFDRALKIRPGYAEAWNNRGATLRRLGRLNEALESYDRALRAAPNFAEAAYNRGIVLSELGRMAEALEACEQALRVKPDYVEAHWNRGLWLLQSGSLALGWDEFEWRWKLADYQGERFRQTSPLWTGQKLRGALLVWNEHGIGDEIFYAGMLNDLHPYAASITVCVDPRLVPLFQRSFSRVQVLSRKALLPRVDFEAHIPMGSLGRYLRRNFNAFPKDAKPYLRASESASQKLRARLAQGNRLVCGLSWFSKNPHSGGDKSLRLLDLLPILNVPDIEFVDLQYGDTIEERAALQVSTGVRVNRLAEIDNFNDIDGLAALIDACDVIVTVSNTTAHLAAALGKPVLLMLPFSQGLRVSSV
jgi:tetratricopeptide (TPR) repeat protein